MYKNKLIEKKGLSSSIISSLTTALFEKNFETEKHTQRVQELALEIGRVLYLEQEKLDNLSLLASLHDIGKIAVSDELLEKKDSRTEREWDILKRHPEIGCSICESSTQLSRIAPIVLSHHEKFDGSGYPQGLKGEEIPFESRIISIIDAFDVMTHDQPYKESIPVIGALKEIKKAAGTQFDPDLIKKFIRLLNRTKVGV